MSSIPEVNEKSKAYLTVSFYDKNGDPDTPLTVKYNVYCLTNGQELRADTSLTPNETVEIELTPSDNVIIDSNNDIEKRLVTVKANYGTNDEVNEEFRYNVVNLRRVS